jgi:hypothetical protein
MREGNYFLKIFDNLKEYVEWIENFNDRDSKIISVIPMENKILVTLKKKERLYF